MTTSTAADDAGDTAAKVPLRDRAPNALNWSRLSSPQRYEAYTRWSVVVLVAFTPFMGVLLLTGPIPWSDAVGGVMAAGYAAFGIVGGFAFTRSLDHALGRRSFPLAWFASQCGLAAVLVGLSSLMYYGAGSVEVGPANSQYLMTLVVVFTPLTIVVSALLRAVWVSLAALGFGLLGAALFAALGEPQMGIVALIVLTVMCVSMGLGMRVSIWSVVLVWDLDRRREVDARLAVAEERLRFSRDLHDVFGRTLSTVAVKSELAAALAQRGDPRGAQEMMAVRSLAQEALREVRGVVQGYRAADLQTELVGAREILTASGISVRMTGEHLELPEPVQRALAWVVREGVTNVVRHSRASDCTIALDRADGGFRLTITNDGVRLEAPDDGDLGNGLRGLTERLGRFGGTVAASTPEDGVFALSAWVPAGIAGTQLANNDDTQEKR